MNPLSRRHFLATAAASAIVGSLARAQQPTTSATFPSTRRSDQPGTLLILGGTGFLGPHQVRYALARGHKVTIANRGRTRPELFDDRENVDELIIDREGDLAELEQAIQTGRRWDAVIDNSGYVPAHVDATASLLKDAADAYLFVSTISVYGNAIPKKNADESHPVEDTTDEQAEKVKTIREVGMLYGPLKYRSENAAKAAFGDNRTCVIRPGLIAGPGDPTDRFTYWPVRTGLAQRCEGKMLQPGTQAQPQPVQFIDVRDLAQFCIHCCEQRTSGVYNAVAPTAHLNEVTSSAAQWYADHDERFAEAVRVPMDFLQTQPVGFWTELPMVVPTEGEMAGFAYLSNAAATAKGLTCRPPADTTTATLDWWQTLPADRTAQLRAGLSEEREAELLAAWESLKESERS